MKCLEKKETPRLGVAVPASSESSCSSMNFRMGGAMEISELLTGN